MQIQIDTKCILRLDNILGLFNIENKLFDNKNTWIKYEIDITFNII